MSAKSYPRIGWFLLVVLIGLLFYTALEVGLAVSRMFADVLK